MPLYEYQCGCGNEKEILLPFGDADQPQICECGKVMQRKMSTYSFTHKQSGRQMALDSLNSRAGGFPDVNKHKSWVQQKTFEGI